MNKLVVVAAFVVSVGGTALAQPALTPPSLTEPAPPVATTTDWYGWQILGADAATFTLAAVSEHGEIALGWIGTGAVVHAAHHNYGRSLLSVGLRIGLPILGMSVGEANAKGCTGDWCDVGDIVVGGMVGMGVAEVIDVAMATEEHAIAPVTQRRWTPVAKIRRSGATVGIAARF